MNLDIRGVSLGICVDCIQVCVSPVKGFIFWDRSILVSALNLLHGSVAERVSCPISVVQLSSPICGLLVKWFFFISQGFVVNVSKSFQISPWRHPCFIAGSALQNFIAHGQCCTVKFLYRESTGGRSSYYRCKNLTINVSYTPCSAAMDCMR
jgi:hypothetical protein